VGIDGEVRELLASGVAVVVATCDARLRPAIARAWGISVSSDGTEATLCVSAPAGSKTRANLGSNAAIAVTCSQPSTYRTVQLKGRVVEIGGTSDEQLARVDAHVEAFSREAEAVGLPPGSGRRLADPGLVSVSFAVSEVYDQTPGPRAGARL
jgi:nitroimidazol reductase NimA-like FMN-containing flavoprotein (pyridoxamine 5'-phosphate oxidase superfamily)